MPNSRMTKTSQTPARSEGGRARMPQPVPAQLATPSDLASADVQAIAQAVNGLVADSFALYLKTKNFHWHLSGVHFRELHLLFDEQAEAIFATIDPLAERVRRLGALTLHSIGEVSRLSSIKDDDTAFLTPTEMVRRLLDDNQRMREAQRLTHEICEESRDSATASLLELYIDETERRIWFLYETLQGLETR